MRLRALAEILRRDHELIISSWRELAAGTAASRGLDRPQVQNLMSPYLHALADAGDELGKCSGRRRELVDSHFAARVREGFLVGEIIEEFAVLGHCIFEVWRSDGAEGGPDAAELQRLFTELQLASALVTERFATHMVEDEQLEKRYARLLETLARRALRTEDHTFATQLEQALALVMEAMNAQTAALLLYHPDTHQLDQAVCIGVGAEQLKSDATTLAPSSFVGQVAMSEEPTSMLDVATTQLEVGKQLRGSGIHSLLGLRVPRHTWTAVMYVGTTDTRPFRAREMQRLEFLGQQLAVHLDNARLFAELRTRIHERDAEKDVREQFVSLLTHDLRGPLTAARLRAVRLAGTTADDDTKRGVALKLVRNLDSISDMVGDLLDANRVRAGQPLELRIADCDLVKVTRELLDELSASHRAGFVLHADREVAGRCGADQVKRALWNLLGNAIKHGAHDRPITVSVRHHARGVRIAVHNEGPPIPQSDQANVFDAFSRGGSGPRSRGWGLGLTLVRACAEAHGGSVSVQSSAELGTTFTLDLPFLSGDVAATSPPN